MRWIGVYGFDSFKHWGIRILEGSAIIHYWHIHICLFGSTFLISNRNMNDLTSMWFWNNLWQIHSTYSHLFNILVGRFNCNRHISSASCKVCSVWIVMCLLICSPPHSALLNAAALLLESSRNREWITVTDRSGKRISVLYFSCMFYYSLLLSRTWLKPILYFNGNIVLHSTVLTRRSVWSRSIWYVEWVQGYLGYALDPTMGGVLRFCIPLKRHLQPMNRQYALYAL